jgi:hypothetical protein
MTISSTFSRVLTLRHLCICFTQMDVFKHAVCTHEVLLSCTCDVRQAFDAACSHCPYSCILYVLCKCACFWAAHTHTHTHTHTYTLFLQFEADAEKLQQLRFQVASALQSMQSMQTSLANVSQGPRRPAQTMQVKVYIPAIFFWFQRRYRQECSSHVEVSYYVCVCVCM